MDISVIIVSWNSKPYLERCLKSLVLTPPSRSMEIIVVDNGSTDGSAEMVCAEFPYVRLIRNKTNLGFAKANNLGIRESRGRYISLVNSDVELLPGCLDALADYLDQTLPVGIVGPRILNPDRTLQSSCKQFPTLWNNLCSATGLATVLKGSRFFSGEHMLFFPHDRIQDVDILIGCFWMVRREALEEVGGLDERFFIYGEDMDWCFRFWKNGWGVHFFPEATAIHYGGASSNAAPRKFYLEMQKANLQYWVKHHRSLSYLYYCVVCVHHLLRLLGYSCFALIRWDERVVHASKAKRSWAALAWLLNPNKGECIT